MKTRSKRRPRRWRPDRPSTPYLRPRVRLHPGGHVTIAGIPYRFARNILTIARLYRYDHDQEHTEAAACRCNQCEAFLRLEVWLLDELERQLQAEVNRTHEHPEPSLKERLRENDQLRQLLKTISRAIDEPQ